MPCGADVYTREAPPTEIPACLTSAGIKCGKSLTITNITSKTIEYGDILLLNELFTNQETSLCPIESCELKTPDCSGSYLLDDVIIDLTGSFDISF